MCDLQGGLTQEQAERIYAMGKETEVFALLEQARLLALRLNLPAADSSTPSVAKPAFAKAAVKDNRRRKAGRRC